MESLPRRALGLPLVPDVPMPCGTGLLIGGVNFLLTLGLSYTCFSPLHELSLLRVCAVATCARWPLPRLHGAVRNTRPIKEPVRVLIIVDRVRRNARRPICCDTQIDETPRQALRGLVIPMRSCPHRLELVKVFQERQSYYLWHLTAKQSPTSFLSRCKSRGLAAFETDAPSGAREAVA